MSSLPPIYLYRRVLKAKFFIEEHYRMPLNLDQISDEASFSKFHFIRLFKSLKAYGKTPHQFLTSYRLEKAKALLQTDMSVSNVCFAVGFESITTFTSLFKHYVAQTPAFYQQEQAKRKLQMRNAPLNFVPNCFAEKIGWKNSNFQ